jgi:hypothetical protein
MPISRRDFVRMGTVALAAGAAVKTTLLDPSALWAEEMPGEGIRFASIGLGVRGCEVLRAGLTNHGTCVGISDLYDGRQRLGREVVPQNLLVTANYRELLDRKDIDAVFVAVPDHLHRRVVTDVCAAGKDVYCEKPMSHNVEDGFAMVAAAQKYNRMMQGARDLQLRKARRRLHDTSPLRSQFSKWRVGLSHSTGREREDDSMGRFQPGCEGSSL